MNKLISYLLAYSSTICFEQVDEDKHDFKVFCCVSKNDVKKMVDLVFDYSYIYDLSFHPFNADVIQICFCIDNHHLPF